LDAKRKRKDEEINSEEDEEPAPKWPKTGGSKPSGAQPSVEIPGPSLAARQPVIEMVGLLRELVEEVRELRKAVRGMSGLSVQLFQQNAKLVRLGECQSYLAEKALKGSGSGSEAGELGRKELRKDEGKGKASEVEETMKSDEGSKQDSEVVLEKDMREDSDVGGLGMDSDTE
jgi:hypothetical protein